MTRLRDLLLVAVAVLCATGPASAVITVNPNGVNVRASGPTTVFLTFQGLDPNERAVEAFWCGAVQPGVVGGNVTTFNPCLPGTLYGSLPLRHDLSRVSQSGNLANLTDIMTIPATVARRAYQDAAGGLASDFFYVRRFTGGIGGDKFVVVTCRMSAAGARTPLALLDVRLAFATERGETPVLAVARETPLPKFGATILYNGTGELRGRWEIVLPGDIAPVEQDLLTEGTLPVERRVLQRRYTLIERFSTFLLPEGRAFIAGPDPARIATSVEGPYQILLRIEATDDKEGQSALGNGPVAVSGGVAGFPLPVLRFYVGSSDAIAALATRPPTRIELMLPIEGGRVGADTSTVFSWVDIAGVELYRLDVESAGDVVLSALVRPGISNYAAPPWLGEKLSEGTRWRVVGLNGAGATTGESPWRALRVK